GSGLQQPALKIRPPAALPRQSPMQINASATPDARDADLHRSHPGAARKALRHPAESGSAS
ncbi:MAG TPA: hypothetical protein PK403_16825, partial [Plasticicumulans sp.]|nr:hypothetical protein [Plasticicumulans sp.]